MTNKIPYNNFPDKNEFVKLYEEKSQQDLAEYYGCNKKRIRKWIDHFSLKKRTKGGGNNRKYNIKIDELKQLIESGYSNKDIMLILGIQSISSLNAYIKKYELKRNYNKKAFEIYSRRVRYLTELEYSKYHKEINPKSLPRTLCGVDGGYQLDHIISIRESFMKNLSCEDCASKNNLQMISWKENLNKRLFHKKDNKNE